MGRFREGGEVVLPRSVADELSFIHREVYGIEFRVGVRGLSAYIHTYIHTYICMYIWVYFREGEKVVFPRAVAHELGFIHGEVYGQRPQVSTHTTHTHTSKYIHTYIHTYVYMGRFREGGEVVFPRAVADELGFIHGEVYGQEFDRCD